MNFEFKNIKIYIFSLLFILLLPKYYTVEIDNSLINQIILNKEQFLIENNDIILENENKYKNFKFYKVDLSNIDNFNEKNKYNFIKINVRIKNNEIFSPLQINVNKTLTDFMISSEEKELFMVDYSLNEKNPTLFLPKKYYETQKYFYFFIQSELNIEYIYTIELIENENIIINGNNRFNILFKPGKISIYYELEKSGIRSGFLSIGLLTSGILEDQNKLSVNAFCQNEEKIIGNNYPYFINGVGAFIYSNDLVKCKNKIVLIEIKNNLNKQIYAEFNTQYIYESSSTKETEKKYYVNDVFTSVLLSFKKNNNNKQCFEFVPQNKEENYYLIVRTISSNLYISISSKNYNKGSSVMFSSILNFKVNKEKNSNSRICFSNENDYISGIQAQIIENNQNLNIDNYYKFTKNPILPLINGFPTESKIMVSKKMIYKVNLNAFYSSMNQNKYKDKIIKYHLIIKDFSKMAMNHLRCKIIKVHNNINSKEERNKICEIIDNISYEVNNNIYLNYNYKIENLLYYEEFVLIECQESSDYQCIFQIEVNVQDNYDSFPTQLLTKNNKNIYSNDIYYFYNSIVKSNINIYKVTISNKLKIGTKIYFILYMFSGDADMAIYDYNDDNKMERVIQDAFYSSIGKKKLLLYEIKKKNKNLYFRDILLKINGISSGYYSVKYYVISDENKDNLSSVPIQEFNLEKIAYNSEKSYSLELPKNKNISEIFKIFDEYYITINTINCIIEASFMNKKYIGREMQILYKVKNLNNELKISLKKLDSNNTEFCTYYISSNPIGYKDNNILISEGIIYSMTLTKKINSVSYIYPYVYDGNTISIALYKYNKEKLNVSVLINNNRIIYNSTLKNINYKKIMIFTGTLEKYCKNIITNDYYKITYLEENYVNSFNFCPIHLKIELANESINYNNNYKNFYQLEIFSSSQTPTYLKANEIVFNSILANQYRLYAKKSEYIYYYSDISNEFPCEIFLNFKYGYGEAVAKIMGREEVDILPTWNRKIRLPTINDNDQSNYLEYDYETNRFIIDEKYKNKCKEGCQVFIGIYCRETSNYFQLNDFYLILNKNDGVPINLYFNNEINDFLTKDIREKYFISQLEDENVDSLFFSFNSNYCKLCVIFVNNINENININNYKNIKCDREFSKENELSYNKEYIFNIDLKDEKLKGKKLTHIKFLSKVYTNIKDNRNNLFYSLKINKKQKNLPLIVKVDSTNNEKTILDNETGFGYFEIHLQDYLLLIELNIFIFSEELIINNNLKLYAKIFSMEEYNENGFNKNMIENIINSKDTFKNNNNNNYLHLELDGNNNDRIILLIVKCFCIDKVSKLTNHYIKIMTSFYKSSIHTSLRSNNYRIYEVDIHPINYFIPLIENKYSILIINCIQGKGKISIYNKYDIIVDDCKNNYKIILDKDNDEKFANIGVFNINGSLNSKDNFIYYMYLLYENKENYSYKITLQKNNYIYYRNTNKNNNAYNFYYDLSFYLEYNRNKENPKFIIIEIQFLNQSIIQQNYNNFDIDCTCTNRDLLYNENNMNLNSIGDIYYNNNYSIFYIIVNINDKILINNNKYRYIYISIKNQTININNNDEYIPIKISERNSNDLREIINNNINILKYSNYNYPFNNQIINSDPTIIDEEKKNDINKNNKKINNGFSKKYLFFLIIIITIIILYTIRCYRKYKIKTIRKRYHSKDIDLPIINN